MSEENLRAVLGGPCFLVLPAGWLLLVLGGEGFVAGVGGGVYIGLGTSPPQNGETTVRLNRP